MFLIASACLISLQVSEQIDVNQTLFTQFSDIYLKSMFHFTATVTHSTSFCSPYNALESGIELWKKYFSQKSILTP